MFFILLCTVAAHTYGAAPLPDDFNPGVVYYVRATVVQPNGKVLVGGSFSQIGGQARNNIARLHADGTLDASFNPGPNNMVCAIVLQGDGKILVGGYFTLICGQSRSNLARLHANGTLDTNFNPRVHGSVYSLALQSDGKVLVGGEVISVGGQSRHHIARLNANGTLDTAFNPGADDEVGTIVVQADGKILVGGEFETLGGQLRNNLARLHADGRLDTSFNPGTGDNVIAVQADGKILMGGDFTIVGGQPRHNIARLHANGTLDTSFNPGADNEVDTIAVQADGKILLGGEFTSVGGLPRSYIARLNADGTVDATFDPGANDHVYSLAIQEDGKVLVGGCFNVVGGQVRPGIARLNSTEPATQNLSRSNSSITWLRGGTSPEVWRTSFQHSSNGMTWTHLGLGQRIAGGWRLAGVTIPKGGTFRARGFVTGGRNSGSSGVVESFLGVPVILTQPASRTNEAGTTAIFSVSAARTGSLSYQWFKDGVLLTENTNLAGTQTATLTLFNVLKGNEGRYRVVVSNSFGSATSVVARLTVKEPLIAQQPVSQSGDFGASVTISITAIGTPPLHYQWWQDSSVFPRAEGPSFTFTNLQSTDAGNYKVVVSNASGSVTSKVASLTVRDPVIIEQPASQVENLGGNVTLRVTVKGTPPLHYQWWKDGSALPGATEPLLMLTNLQKVDSGNYSVVVSNTCGSEASRVAEVSAQRVIVDKDFVAEATNYCLALALAMQRDQKILLGGSFTMLNGESRRSIARLHPDGTLDTSFKAETDYTVTSLLVQSDGKILVSGDFQSICRQPVKHLARLNADGTLDTSFNPRMEGNGHIVNSLALQADGKILVAGSFTNVGAQARSYLARLQADGTLDIGFNPGAHNRVNAMAVQPDGKIVVGGQFTRFGSYSRTNLARLLADGTLDTGFNPDSKGSIHLLAVQPDGKILVGSQSNTLNGYTVTHLTRLHADGTSETGFTPALDGRVYSLAMQSNGKIVLAGSFTRLGAHPCPYLGRLHTDGTVDTEFETGALFRPNSWDSVSALAVQADGRVLCGGYFQIAGGETRKYIARLKTGEPVTQNLSYDGSAIAWLRGGISPEVWRTTFHHSADGQAWTHLGSGERIPGGWRLTGVTAPAGGTLRACGFMSSGQDNDSSGMVETFLGHPAIIVQPTSNTKDFGEMTSFSVDAGSAEPLSYQWFRDGVALAQETGLAGARTATLTLSNVFKGNEGSYHVVISNSLSSVTSVVAKLTVNDPLITEHPAGQYGNIGENVTLHVTATGTPPLNYQWWKDGNVLAEASGPSLVITNFQSPNTGNYWAVVSNALGGSQTSSVAMVFLNLANVDSAFHPPTNGIIYSLALQPDGKILLGGGFGLVRLHADGTLDANFAPRIFGKVNSVAVEADGRILVGGGFQSVNGERQAYLARLSPEGTLDRSITLPDRRVTALGLQSDGKILVGGEFYMIGSQIRYGIARLGQEGMLDTGFDTSSSSTVYSFVVQSNGQILVGSDLYSFSGQTRKNLGRLYANGTLDTNFNPQIGGYRSVQAVAVQADGKILIGGTLTNVSGQPRACIARLNADGTLDIRFKPWANASINAFALQADGKILVVGDFTTMNSQPRSHLARLHSDGTLDLTFNPGANASVLGLAIQVDGNILVAGSFTNLGGNSRPYLARLNRSEPAPQNLSIDGTTITWLRGGTSPEVCNAVFEQSTNGLAWTRLGEGIRIPGGWRLSGVTVPASKVLRARGFVSGGQYNASAWITESYWPPANGTFFGIHQTNDLITLQIGGQLGQLYQLEYAPALGNPNAWTSLGSFIVTNNPQPFSDPSFTNMPLRYYRLKSITP